MKAKLKKNQKNQMKLYHYKKGVRVVGVPSDLSGDCSGLRGNCSGLSGDCSDLSGDLDACEISENERKDGVDIMLLIKI